MPQLTAAGSYAIHAKVTDLNGVLATWTKDYTATIAQRTLEGNATIAAIDERTTTGSAIEPDPVVTDTLNGQAVTLVRETDYTVMNDHWGFELLKPDEQRLRTRDRLFSHLSQPNLSIPLSQNKTQWTRHLCRVRCRSLRVHPRKSCARLRRLFQFALAHDLNATGGKAA